MIRTVALSALMLAGSALAEPPPAMVETGKAVTCIPLGRDHHDRAVDARTILFTGGFGARTWRNDLPAACPGLTKPDVAIGFRSTTDEICAGDLITVFDPVTHFDYGGCVLGQFTPVKAPAGHR